MTTIETLTALFNNTHTSHVANIHSGLVSFFRFIKSDKELNFIINELLNEYDNTSQTEEKEIQNAIQKIENSRFKIDTLKFNAPEIQLVFQFKVLDIIYKSPNKYYSFLLKSTVNTSSGKQAEVKALETNNYWLRPIYNFLILRLKEKRTVLKFLFDYKAKREWFYREIFFSQYKNSERKEDFLDMDIRSYLFEKGIEFPFSAPNSPSGRGDIIANLNSDDPLILEVKFVDNEKKYSKGRIISGIVQAHAYAKDYNKNIGYVVVFNANSNDEVVNIDNNNILPCKINIDGIEIYILVININPDGKKASERKTIKTVNINREEILKEIK